MNPLDIGIIGIVLLLAFFAIGMPIAFAMAVSGIIMFVLATSPGPAISLIGIEVYTHFSSYPLSAIPMFILMGGMALAAGIGRKLYTVAYITLGQLRGGLAIASTAACLLFGAVCASSSATCATIGKIAVPEMRKYGYSDVLATGTIASSGGLGLLIPPSGSFIVYGLLTGNSIGKLFISGIFPGILMGVLLMITAAIYCWRDPQAGPAGPKTTSKEKVKSLIGLTDTIILFALSMGGMFAGWFSPTQAGAIGSAGAIIIGLARRELTWKTFKENAKDSVRIGCMVIMLITGALIYSRFLAVSGISQIIFNTMVGWSASPLMVIILISVLFLILGFFIDMAAVIVLFVPLFYPVVVGVGFDPIWFGVLVVVLGIIGITTPPVAVNCFVTQGLIPGLPLSVVFKGVYLFMPAMIITLILLIIFPQISTFLPSLLPY